VIAAGFAAVLAAIAFLYLRMRAQQVRLATETG
jgi:hypothetical protein